MCQLQHLFHPFLPGGKVCIPSPLNLIFIICDHFMTYLSSLSHFVNLWRLFCRVPPDITFIVYEFDKLNFFPDFKTFSAELQMAIEPLCST